MNNVLVLGSAGQVGAYLVQALDKNGYNYSTFDITATPFQDLRRHSDYLEDLIKESDFVFFLAFDVGGSRYLSKYQHTFEFIDNNIKLMDNTFSLLHKYNKKFIFASSQMSNMSYSPYGVLKAVGEQYTKVLNGRTVKFWNVYGIEHDLEKSHVITDFIIKARDTGIIDMLTDGQEEREFLYADDCSNALIAVMKNFDEINKDAELHITSFYPTKIIEIARIIANRIGARIIPSDKKDTVQMDKRNQPDEFILNFWKPETSLQDGIHKIIKAMTNEV